MMLNHYHSSHASKILKIVGTFFEIDDYNELIDRIFIELETIFKSEKSTLIGIDYFTGQVDFKNIKGHNIENKNHRLYAQYYYQLDPFYKKHTHNYKVYTDRKLCSERYRTRTEYYNDFLKPQNIHHQMSSNLKTGNSQIGKLSLFRQRSAPAFSTDEKTLMEILIPHISIALQKVILANQKYRQEYLIDFLGSKVRKKGVVLVTKSLKTLYMNDHARNILAGISNKSPNQEKNVRLPKDILALLQKKTEQETDRTSVQPEDYVNRVIECEGQRIIMDIKQIMIPGKAPCSALLFEPEFNSQLRTEFLIKKGITRREREITHLVTAGLKNSEIAKKLFISENTVDNHIKSIFKKMGVHNRTSLAHKLNYPDSIFNTLKS